MASKFMDETPLAGMEAQMQMVPGFRPRRGGVSVSRLETPRAQGGGGQAEGQGDCGPPGGGSPCGTPGNGCGSFPCLLERFTGEVDFGPFTDRVSHLEGSTGCIYRDESHRERFQNQWNEQGDVPDRDAMCAALYLLTADQMLWGMAAQAVRPELIDFASICIRGVGLDGYVLFHTAKDLYKGTNRLSLSELTDPELISDCTFRTVITAFLIRRHGEGILEEERSG
ncbi:MAG: hypothetical protein NC306_08880 [Butyrivibrio sp.]|nr:hypothetical protein [Butyrivibrio sp.]